GDGCAVKIIAVVKIRPRAAPASAVSENSPGNIDDGLMRLSMGCSTPLPNAFEAADQAGDLILPARVRHRHVQGYARALIRSFFRQHDDAGTQSQRFIDVVRDEEDRSPGALPE